MMTKRSCPSNLRRFLWGAAAFTFAAMATIGTPGQRPAFAAADSRSGISQTTRKPSTREFDPQRQPLISSETDAVLISLKRTEPCSECGGERAFVFEVRNKLHGGSKEFRLRNKTAQVDGIFIVNAARALILGSASGTARVANVVDLTDGSVIDFFYCLFPAVSKSHRFLAYVKYVPHFASPLEWSYVYLVYDLTGSAAQNRLSVSKEDQIEVGVPVFPLENAQRGIYEPLMTSEAEAHILASEGLFWLDDHLLAFVDRNKNGNQLVTVRVGEELGKPKTKVVPIPTASVLDVGRCRESAGRLENLVYVERISIPREKGKHVRLHVSATDPCVRSSTLDLEIGEPE